MMEKKEVYEKLNTIFRDNFDDDSIELTDRTTADDIAEWDSLEQVNLVVAIQEQFHIKFNVEEAMYMKNVKEIADYIIKKLY